ncbi:MAG: SDR family NAD(P)-dependent oxidoreductase [Bacteroidota bacterium]
MVHLSIASLTQVPQAIDETIGAKLADIQTTGKVIKSFIYLHPQFEFQTGRFAEHFSMEKLNIQIPFFAAKHLQAKLNELGPNERINFTCFTQLDGQMGWGRRGNTSIVGRGLCGLVKSLNLEWSPVFCRYADLEPELSPEQKAQAILGELWDANYRITEVAVSATGRTTLGTRLTDVPERQSIQTSVTKDSVFLVSGGAKGVTAACVIEMAKTFQCKFILLGRSDNTLELPDFAHQSDEEGVLKRLIMEDLKAKGEKPSLPLVKKLYSQISSKKEIDHTLSQISTAGAQAIYVQGDVTKVATVLPAVKQAQQELGKITGVIHGAGRLADKYIQDKSATDFSNVISVKLDGLLTLFGCVDIHHLDHLILFSSVAGFYGNVGQTDYAMANEILSAAAHLFKTNHPNTQVSAVNWGAWDSGMVSPALKKKFAEAGVSLVSTKGGPAMLVNELNTEYAHQAQVIIGGTLPMGISVTDNDLQTYKIHRRLEEEANPFLQHHVIQGKAVLPVVNAVGWMAQSCERLYPDFRIYRVEDTKLFKGLVFDGSEPREFTVELKELEKNGERIVFEATVMSPGAKLPTYHYNARVVLAHVNHLPEAPVFKQQSSGSYQATDGAVLYQDGSLFHDTYFRGIEEILDWTPEQIILRCQAPTVPLAEQGQFAISSVNTFFSDIQYQGMVIWVQRYFEGAKSLPLSTVSATLYADIPFEKELLVHVKIVESNEFKLVADCTVYDDQGKVYMKTEGAAVTVSKQLQW